MKDQTELRGGVHGLAALLSDHAQEIENRWLRRVSQELNRHGLTETELRDSIPDYIQGLAQSLRRHNGTPITERGVEAWAGTAQKHAVTRIRLGFDIDEVLREFLILRAVIIEVLGEHAELTIHQCETVNILIGGALRACVKSYVDSRDFEARKEQAKHIGFITHELRNPLSVAMTAASQIRKQGLPDQGRQNDLLNRNLKRLDALIEEALLAQQLEVHAVESHPVEVRLGAIVVEAVKAADEASKEKGVEFEVTYDPDIMLHVDPKLAVSAVQNIVDNAAKFTDHGRVLMEVEDAPAEIVIHVFDECDGLSPEELRTIFEPFKRGHSGKAGTGLGLSIARMAVEAHGKTIHAESTGSKGCHFWFALPKAAH